MSEQPFFSVVIPVYNKGPHIQRSISSVLNQAFQDFELILINDASTDTSLEEMHKFTDPRIRILHRDQPGPGGYAARNLGIKEARAEWVAFLDADDEWFPEHLERMYALSRKFGQANVMGCGCQIVRPPEEGGRKGADAFFTKHQEVGDHYLSFEQYLEAEAKGQRPLNGTTACIKKNAIINLSHTSSSQNGLMVPVRSPQALADAVEQLIADSALREKCSQNARKTVEMSFSKKSEIDSWMRVLQGSVK